MTCKATLNCGLRTGQTLGARIRAAAGGAFALALLLSAADVSGTLWAGQQSQQGPPASTSAQKDTTQADKSTKGGAGLPADKFLPRGKKLCMTDGNYQIVRSYERQGDSVRYYSLERSAWEEIPASLIDWEATKKAEADQERQQKELADAVRERERQRNAVEVLDVDASLEVAPGLILPQDEGMFAVANKKITFLPQTRTMLKADKKRVIEKIFIPGPILSTRQLMEIKGKHAILRLPAGEVEFFYRTAADAEGEPDVELVHAKEKGDARMVEWISTDIVGNKDTDFKEVSLLRWQVAKGVYRYTIAQPLDPGEYALAVILPEGEGINMFVWDFGLDNAAPSPSKPK
jgi:hypothetical protein